jgi:hypothetical protein
MTTEEEFIKGRVERIRELAANADPFIKRRLLDLANSYERRLNQPARLKPMSIGAPPPAPRDERG